MIRTITIVCFFASLILSSCSTDVELNDPSLQAMLGEDFFRASTKKATIQDDGTLILSGLYDDQSVSFSTSTASTGKYKLGNGIKNKASLSINEYSLFLENEQSEGEIEITEVYNNAVSGTFYFRNLKDANGNSIDVTSGWFYRIPIDNYEAPEITTPTNPDINPCLDNASLTATIDGVPMNSSKHSAQVFGVNDDTVLIKAENISEEITLLFPIDTNTGMYPLAGSALYSASYSHENAASSASSGELTITTHDKESKCISGSFQFETRTGITISQGVFDFGY